MDDLTISLFFFFLNLLKAIIHNQGLVIYGIESAKQQ